MNKEHRYNCLDLSSYFNNKGITSEKNIMDATLSFGKSSFPAVELPLSNVFYYRDIPFKFGRNTLYDNIELSCQKIVFSPLSVESVHVLGVSNNGDFFDNVYFLSENKIVECGKLHFTDFMSSEPAFSDQVAIRARYLHTITGKYHHVKPTMWYDSIQFKNSKKVDTIQFEDNPAMHIFAITFKLEENRGNL